MAATPMPRDPGGAPAIPSVKTLRYGAAAAGGLLLLLGVVAVFTTLNGFGTVALLLSGAALLLASLWGRLPSLAVGARSDTGPLMDLLRSADPTVRMAAAEAVLDSASRPEATGEVRTAALGVLLQRDLVRRLADLLRRAGHVVESDTLAHGGRAATADIIVRVTGAQGLRPIPLVINSSAGADDGSAVQGMAAVVSRFGARAGVLLYTGAQPADVPLGSVTPFGDAVVFTVYSPRLVDEQAILSAVSRAADVRSPAAGASAPQDSPRTESTG